MNEQSSKVCFQRLIIMLVMLICFLRFFVFTFTLALSHLWTSRTFCACMHSRKKSELKPCTDFWVLDLKSNLLFGFVVQVSLLDRLSVPFKVHFLPFCSHTNLGTWFGTWSTPIFLSISETLLPCPICSSSDKTTLFIEKEIHAWIDDEILTLPRPQPWYIFCILKSWLYPEISQTVQYNFQEIWLCHESLFLFIEINIWHLSSLCLVVFFADWRMLSNENPL